MTSARDVFQFLQSFFPELTKLKYSALMNLLREIGNDVVANRSHSSRMCYLEDQHVLILEMPLTCPNLGQPASPDYCRTGRDKSKTGGNLFRIWLFSLTVKLNSSLKEGWPSGHHLFCDRTFLLILLILTEQFSNLTNAKISSHFISAKWHFLHRRKGSFMNHSFEGRNNQACLL